MKKIIWTFALASIPFCAFLQNDLSNIENHAECYFAALEQRNVASLLSYLYLEKDSQSTKKVIQQIFGDTVLQLEYSNSCIAEISEITMENKVKYAIVFFTTQLEINVPNQSRDFIARKLQSIFGKRNVCNDFHSRKICVEVIDCMYAVKSDVDKSWKFITGDLDSDDRSPVPQKVVDKFALPMINWIAKRISY